MFDWRAHIASFDPRLFESPEGRRAVCETDPLMFALVYMPHHISMDDDEGKKIISFAECHIEWCEIAKYWYKPNPRPREHRHAFLAPRATGKSTWWFTILPIWWAAYGHSRFIAAFADSGSQAELHLMTFKQELESNELLQLDFPDLCEPGRRKRGTVQGDAKNIRISKNGFVFMAKGIDSQSLGMKIGTMRPDTILFDDVEPDEANYSEYQMEQRLITVLDAVLPLNERARVALSGTVTMPGSITHQLIKHGKGEEDPDGDREWIIDENFRVHHAMPIVDNGDGTERSFWPEKWTMEYLLSIRHTRSYRKNFENNPMAADGDYWNEEDFTYGSLDYCSSAILSIDGAVTVKKESDYTGVAVIGFQPAKKTSSGKQHARCVVKYSRAVKLRGDPFRKFIMQILESFPEIRGILVETNQGGDMWLDTLHGMPVKILTLHNEEKKESRAGRLLNLYQLIPTRVLHETRQPALEEQMVAFPNGANDDLVDAVGNAVLRYMRPERKVKPRIRTLHPR